MVNHFRQRPQYAVLLACLIGLAVYFASGDWLIVFAAFALWAMGVVAVLAIPFALLRFLWRAGSRMGQR